MNKSRPVRVQLSCTPAERDTLKAAAAFEGSELGPWLLELALAHAGSLDFVPDETVPEGGQSTRWPRFEAAVRAELAEWAPRRLATLADPQSTGHSAVADLLAATLGASWAPKARERSVAARLAREMLAERGAR